MVGKWSGVIEGSIHLMTEVSLTEERRSVCIQSFSHARRGVRLFFKTTPNAQVEVFIFFCTLVLGAYLQIARFEWLFLLGAAALVFVAEAINSAIEIDINLTSPEYHPFARDTKDVAAGAVLIASLFALVTGLFLFIPRLFVLLL